jgi:hypothetical protein
LADVGDAALRDGHIGLSCGLARTVINLRTADDQVMHLSKTLLLWKSSAGDMPNDFLDYRQLPAAGCRAVDIRVFQSLQTKCHPLAHLVLDLGRTLAVAQSKAPIRRKPEPSK